MQVETKCSNCNKQFSFNPDHKKQSDTSLCIQCLHLCESPLVTDPLEYWQKPAPFFPRLLATIIDTFFVLFLCLSTSIYIVFSLPFIRRAYRYFLIGIFPETGGVWVLGEKIAWVLTMFGVYYLYYLYFTGLRGITPGGKLFRLRIKPTSGGQISNRVVTKRYFAFFATIITLGLGLLLSFFNKKSSRALHDYISGTEVIQEKILTSFAYSGSTTDIMKKRKKQKNKRLNHVKVVTPLENSE